MGMDRRDFLKTVAAAGIGVGLAGWTGSNFFKNHGSARAAEGDAPDAPDAADEGGIPDLVAVRNGEPDAMFDRGIAVLGGMERFVKKGQTVLVKPNASPGHAPEYASDTNPVLVGRIIKHCFDAGAAKVYVMDHTFQRSAAGELRNFETTGLAEVIRQTGATYAPASEERFYEKVEVKGVHLKETEIHKAVLESEVLINVPILKHHGGAGMTCAIKHLMGLVYNRGVYHGEHLQQCIADFLTYRTPDLNVVDAYRILLRNGPGGGNLDDVRQTGMQLLSTDIVAVDAAAALIFGKKPEEVEHIRLAHEMGFGEIDPAKVKIRRLTL